MRRNPWVVAAVTVAVLVVVENEHWLLTRMHWYNALHRNYPWFLAESIDKISGAVLCVATIWLLRRNGLRGILDELALATPVLPAIGFALACSGPMLIAFVLTRRFSPSNTFLPLFFMTIFAPIVEEIEYRGFGVRQFQRGTGWPFWLVVWPSAFLFGWGHVEQGTNWQEQLGIFLITGTGAVVVSWLLQRWQNLWFPIMLHIAMNLWWELFSVARTAVGGWFPAVWQILTMVLAIAITLWRTKPQPRAVQRAEPA